MKLHRPLAKDKKGNRYTCGDDGRIWYYHYKPNFAVEVAHLRPSRKNPPFKLLLWRSNHEYHPSHNGWRFPYSILFKKKSYPFKNIVVRTAVDDKGHAYTGIITREKLKHAPRITWEHAQYVIVKKKLLGDKR